MKRSSISFQKFQNTIDWSISEDANETTPAMASSAIPARIKVSQGNKHKPILPDN